MDELVSQFLSLEVAIKYLPTMLRGLLVTIRLAFFVVISGLFLGLGLALLRTLRNTLLTVGIVIYADFMRCLPPLTLMFVFFFAFPLIGVPLSGQVSAWLALSLVLAAFSEEIFWTAFLSVDKGQWDAARATGLSFARTIGDVILPQALRISIPPLTNRTIGITKGVALASAVAVPEMLGEAIAATSYSSNSTPLIMAAVGYLAIFFPLTFVSQRMEARFRWSL